MYILLFGVRPGTLISHIMTNSMNILKGVARSRMSQLASILASLGMVLMPFVSLVPAYAMVASTNVTKNPTQVTVINYHWFNKAEQFTGFGFSIPSGATIDGISVQVQRHDFFLFDQNDFVKLVKNGNPVGNNEAGSGSWSGPLFNKVETFGSSIDTWGQTWTPQDVNASNFGVVISDTSILNLFSGKNGALGLVSMTINYSLADQVITVTQHAPSSATYGDSFTVAATGGASGNPVTIAASGSCSGAGNNSTTIMMKSGAGTCTVTYNQAGTSSYNPAPQVTETTAASKKSLTITANNATKTYGDTLSFAGTEFTNSTLVTGDSIASVSLASAGAAASSPVSGSPYDITASNATGVGLSNYAIQYATGKLTVNTKNVTVSATGVNETYDGTTNATVVPTVNGALVGDAVGASYSAAFETPDVGTNIPVHVTTIALTGADAGNYNLTNTTTDTAADIASTTAIVTLDAGQNLNPTYDATPKSLTFSTTPKDLPLNVTYNGSSTAPTDAGTYKVVATITDPNYSGSDAETLTIAQAVANVFVEPYALIYDGATHTASSTATGVGGVDLSNFLDFSGTKHTDVGTYAEDSWTFAGGLNYTDQHGTVNDAITKADAHISITPYTVAYDESSHTATGTATGIDGVDLSNELVFASTTHTDIGVYATDTWAFIDTTGNYNDATGTITDTISAEPIVVHTLQYNAGANGTITGSSTQSVADGTSGSEVTAAANSGYHFVNWSDNATSSSRTDTNVTADITVTANFAADASNNSGGGGGGSSGSGGSSGGGNGPIVGSITSPLGVVSSNGPVIVPSVPQGTVLGASTGPQTCTPFITGYVLKGAKNDPSVVSNLQTFLRQFENEKIDVTGAYDDATFAAVERFQAKYASSVLAPWGYTAPTGYVYITTQREMNNAYCKGTSNFPLTDAQKAEISSFTHHTDHSSKTYSPKQNPSNTDGFVPSVPAPTATTTASSPVRKSFWQRLGDFLFGNH